MATASPFRLKKRGDHSRRGTGRRSFLPLPNEGAFALSSLRNPQFCVWFVEGALCVNGEGAFKRAGAFAGCEDALRVTGEGAFAENPILSGFRSGEVPKAPWIERGSP
jgi:hypothetical protein